MMEINRKEFGVNSVEHKNRILPFTFFSKGTKQASTSKGALLSTFRRTAMTSNAHSRLLLG